MLYLLAIIFPPLAVLLCGKWFQFFLSIGFTLCFWIPGIIHAMLVVSDHKAGQRNKALISAVASGKGG